MSSSQLFIGLPLVLVLAFSDRDVRPWLDLVDELRAHGISQDLPLPQIAVMGDQSCGKSSVLEVCVFMSTYILCMAS